MRRQNTSVLQVEGSRIQRSTVEDQKSGISSFFIFNLINFEFVGFQGRWIMTLQSMYNNATIIFFVSFTSLVESPSACCDELVVLTNCSTQWFQYNVLLKSFELQYLVVLVNSLKKWTKILQYLMVSTFCMTKWFHLFCIT